MGASSVQVRSSTQEKQENSPLEWTVGDQVKRK